MSDNGSRADGGPPGRMRLGGMALRNGLLVHGPTSWAAAARTADGTIESVSGPKPSFARGSLGSAPLLRGPLRLAEAFAIVPMARLRLRSARLPLEDPAVVVAAAGATIASGAARRAWRATATRETALALLGALPALAALRDRDLAAYHGVEHKAIGAYERGAADPSSVPKEHARCGSNLVVPLLVLSICAQVAVNRIARRPGPLARALAGAAGVSVAVELFAHAERNPESPVARALQGTGHEIQRRFSTREPTSDQLAVGVAALDELLRAEGQAADTV